MSGDPMNICWMFRMRNVIRSINIGRMLTTLFSFKFDTVTLFIISPSISILCFFLQTTWSISYLSAPSLISHLGRLCFHVFSPQQSRNGIQAHPEGSKPGLKLMVDFGGTSHVISYCSYCKAPWPWT